MSVPVWALAAGRHGIFPALTVLTTPPSMTWMADWGMSAVWIAAVLAGAAGLYALSARGVMTPEDGDMLSQLSPSKAAYYVSAALLLGFAVYAAVQGA